MALDPHSEQPDVSLPEDYRRDHPAEHPTDWGWHGEWGATARRAGWVVAAILLLMITTTHYNFSGGEWLILFAAAIVGALALDTLRSSGSWRARARTRQVPVGLCLFLVIAGLILEFAPRGSDRALALNVIGAAISILGALGLASRLAGARLRSRPRIAVGVVKKGTGGRRRTIQPDRRTTRDGD